MTPRYYHTPPPPASTRRLCPVCHQSVYSRADIHPQCAVLRSERAEPKGRGEAKPVLVDLEPAFPDADGAAPAL